LAANDVGIEKVDFTLKDIRGKKVTLSELRGKIVLVNFWATWCPPCRKEMPDLNAIYTHFQSQGLVILSISDESLLKVGPFITSAGYHPPVLLDDGGKVAKQFHGMEFRSRSSSTAMASWSRSQSICGHNISS
jgi:peroxiredoxin